MSDVSYIKNAVVKENTWVADWFYETRENGFVAAVHVYETPEGSFPVLFDGKVACFLMDDETHLPASEPEIKNAVASMYRSGMVGQDLEIVFEDSFYEIGQQGLITDKDVLDRYGFSEDQVEDIAFRMDDVGKYYFTTEEDM